MHIGIVSGGCEKIEILQNMHFVLVSNVLHQCDERKACTCVWALCIQQESASNIFICISNGNYSAFTQLKT